MLKPTSVTGMLVSILFTSFKYIFIVDIDFQFSFLVMSMVVVSMLHWPDKTNWTLDLYILLSGSVCKILIECLLLVFGRIP